MRYFLLFLIIAPLLSFSQETAITESGKKVKLNKDGTWVFIQATSADKAESTFTKKINDNKESYMLSGVVMIKNGKEEKVPVTFSGSVPVQSWDNLAKTWKDGEADFFSFVCKMLSLEAQYKLKNNLSFEPFPKQFFLYYDNSFKSSYKMIGRNGYGNLIETSSLVSYDPAKEKK